MGGLERLVKVPPDTNFSGAGASDKPEEDLPIQEIFPELAVGVEWTLDRTRELLRRLNNPHLSYPTLHVGGTNGKGSVAAVWARILQHRGVRVGLFTSPHLCAFQERFQIGGRPVSARELLEAAEDLRGPVARHGLTFFEAATVLAFHLFARAEVEVGLVEVGLGGRLDSTNVVEPEVTAITNVALDHSEYLGDTLMAIAGEKAGIIKSGAPVFTAEPDPDLREVFRSRAGEVDTPFHVVDPSREIRELEVAPKGNAFTLLTETWGSLPLISPLPGRHQAANVNLAVRCLEVLGPDLRPSLDDVIEGVEDVRWPGRLQIERGPDVHWVFDVAHNTAAAHALAEALPHLALPEPLVLLMGIQGDKNWRAMLPPLFELTHDAVLTQPPSVLPDRRWDPLQAAGALEARPNLHIVPEFREAMELAREAAKGGTVVVTGSHHTVGDAMNLLGLEPYGEG